MVLIRNGEEEERGVVLRACVDVVQEVIDQHGVGRVERLVDGDELGKARFVEHALVKAEVFVHIAAVIEPRIARVAVERVVALRLKIADKGIRCAAELLMLAVTGEEAPFGVRCAAGKNVGEKVAGNAALFQLVQRLIDPAHRGKLAQRGKIRQVGERLEHDADDCDLLFVRNVGVPILRERLIGVAVAVALRRVGKHILHAEKEGIGRAAGNVDLDGRPGGDEIGVGGRLVDVRAGVVLKAAAKRERERRHDAREPCPGTHALPAQHQQRQRQQQQKALDDNEHRRGYVEGVLVHDAARRAQQAQVACQHRVAAQLHLVVACERKRKKRQRREKVRRPRPREEKKAEVDEQHRRKQIHHHEQRDFEVRLQKRGRVDGGIGVRREIEREQADARAERREPEKDPDAVHPAHHRARGLVRPHQGGEKTHVGAVPFPKNIIRNYIISVEKTQPGMFPILPSACRTTIHIGQVNKMI